MKVHLGLEEERAAHEDASRDDDRSPAARGQMVDGSLDRLGVHRGAVSYRTELSDYGFRRSLCTCHQRRSAKGSCKHERHEPATIAITNGHNFSCMQRPRMRREPLMETLPLAKQQLKDHQ